jgi:hypothetical protein
MPVAVDIDAFLDHAIWYAVRAQRQVFAGLAPGACIGIVPRAVARREDGSMLLWQATDDGLASRRACFAGFARCDADMMFVVDDEAMAALDGMAPGEALAALRRQVRRGTIVLYFLKCEGALVALGYEGFLETLGLTIMGACR